MKWFYKVQGSHTHVRVFMNGGKCGDLCFRNEEFEQVMRQIDFATPFITWIDETPGASQFQYPDPTPDNP